MRTVLAFVGVMALSGCVTYDLSLMPRGPGAMAYGTAKQIDKSVSITIGDDTYLGKYAYMQGGAFTLGTALSGAATATGSAIGVSAIGNGNLLARSSNGHNLRCVFSFSGWSQQGAGTCATDSGTLYDLQIAR